MALILLLPATVFAEIQASPVEVEGYAAIVAGRKDQAREAALQNAFRRAVEQVVGVAVESKTVVKDSELMNDKIFSKSKGFIKTYRIISEKAEPDAYRVTVVASVSRHKLEQGLDDVGLLMRKLGKPRVAIAVVERNGELPAAPGGIVESHLVSAFQKKGYTLVDRQTMLAVEREAVKGSGDITDAVVRAALSGGAEVVIVGDAVARPGTSLGGTNLKPVQVTATCKAVEADTGETLATYTASVQTLHVNQATGGAEGLKKAAQEMDNNLGRQMLAAWGKRLSGLRMVRLTVVDLPFSDIALLKDSIKEKVTQVEDVHERGYRDRQLRIDLEMSGSARSMVDELASLDFNGRKIKITGFSAGQIQSKWNGLQEKGRRKP